MVIEELFTIQQRELFLQRKIFHLPNVSILLLQVSTKSIIPALMELAKYVEANVWVLLLCGLVVQPNAPERHSRGIVREVLLFLSFRPWGIR